MQTEASKYK